MFTSDVQKHTNHQQMSAVASTVAGEAVATPGYSDSIESGMVVMSALLLPNSEITGWPMGSVSDLDKWNTQIQTGDRAAVPALLKPNEVGYFGDVAIGVGAETSGAIHQVMPVPIAILSAPPVIVMPDFTICHRGMNKNTHNSENVYVAIFYRTALIHSTLYTRLLRQQQRIS
jgi:hypothetical protein